MAVFFPVARVLCVALGVGLLSACGAKLSLEKYDRIQVGQGYEEVRQILGDPAHCDEALGVRTCQWGDSRQSVRVNFALDKVVLKSAENLK